MDFVSLSAEARERLKAYRLSRLADKEVKLATAERALAAGSSDRAANRKLVAAVSKLRNDVDKLQATIADS